MISFEDYKNLNPSQQAAIQAQFKAQQAEMETLKAENERLKAEKAKGLTFRMKVSEKGAISIYGMGRFPVTLYKSQMLRLLDQSETIRQFISDNDGALAEKG